MVQWPPFSLVLVASGAATDYPHADVTAWLELGVNDRVAEFAVELPRLRLVSETAAMPHDYEPALV